MQTNLHTRRLLPGMLLATMMFPLAAMADNPNYEAGDLVLYFQKDGATATVHVSLGNAALAFRGTASGPGAANQVNFLDIHAELEAAFGGTGWAADPAIYAGVAAVRSTTAGTTVTNGDPKRTIYVSQARQTVGSIGLASSSGQNIATDTDTFTGSGQISSMLNVFDNNGVDAIEVIDTPPSEVKAKNPISLGIQGTAFGIIGGGVQQKGDAASFGSFGAAGTVEFALDVYRILASTGVAGQVSGPLRQGTYEGTITINSSGMVSFISQGASSAYTTWMNGFTTQIPNAPDREPGADPDKDDIENVLEFVLNGNPSVSSQTILPTLNASGSNFVFNFARRADSAGEVTQVFEYSTNLVDWTTKPPITIPSTPGTSGFVTVGPSTGTAPNEVQNITLTIPKGADTKLFGRLKAVK